MTLLYLWCLSEPPNVDSSGIVCFICSPPRPPPPRQVQAAFRDRCIPKHVEWNQAVGVIAQTMWRCISYTNDSCFDPEQAATAQPTATVQSATPAKPSSSQVGGTACSWSLTSAPQLFVASIGGVSIIVSFLAQASLVV